MLSHVPQNWSDNDRFWMATYAFEFNPSRLAAAPEEAASVLRLTDTAPRAAILDMACGPGRHAIEFARAGNKVTGVDVTPGYIDMAKRSARKAGVEANFLIGDARTYVRSDSYDLVTNLFTSFGYFEVALDNLKVLENAHASLKPRGCLIIDTVNGPSIARHKRVHDRRVHQNTTLDELSIVSEDGKHLIGQWTLTNPDGSVENFTFALWLYSASDLQKMLNVVGFTRVTLWGSLAGNPFSDQSQRLIVVATK